MSQEVISKSLRSGNLVRTRGPAKYHVEKFKRERLAQHSPSENCIDMFAAIGLKQTTHGKAIYSERRGGRAHKVPRFRSNCRATASKSGN